MLDTATFPAAEVSAAAAKSESGRIARSVMRVLLSAAFFFVIRGTIFPRLIAMIPKDGPVKIDLPDGLEVRLVSFGMAALLVVLAMWARRDPLSASLCALAAYVGVSLPSVLDRPTLIGNGNIGKIAMTLILLRAVAGGIWHRVAAADRREG